jgi:hypothetical protein
LENCLEDWLNSVGTEARPTWKNSVGRPSLAANLKPSLDITWGIFSLS